MAARGKNIQLFLMDGDASGRIKCTLANWTGVAFRIPRTKMYPVEWTLRQGRLATTSPFYGQSYLLKTP